MKKKLIITYLLLVFFVTSFAQIPTWSTNIANIIYSNCSGCHHVGAIGTITLMSYQDAVDYSTEIQTQVNDRKMPPWPPDPAYNHFKGERILSQTDIDSINSWVDNYTPSGNLSEAPPAPTFSTASQLSYISQTIQMPTYTLQSDSDEYRDFVIPSGLLETKYVNKVEVIPGDGSAVHHLFISFDSTQEAAIEDVTDPLPGFEVTGTITAGSEIIGSWVPGSSYTEYPNNTGVRVPANSYFILEIHYAPGHIGEVDSTKVNIVYAVPSSDIREIYVMPTVTNAPQFLEENYFAIAPNSTATFHADFQAPQTLSLISVAPHMHLIGQTIRAWLTSPLGDSLPIIYIPHWDFHWQGFYTFQKIYKVPSGFTLRLEGFYDNTSNNPNNPNDPPQWVFAGESTDDEMMWLITAFMSYLPGDENIVLDSSILTTGNGTIITAENTFEVNPTLFHGGIFIQSNGLNGNEFSVNVFDLLGKKVFMQKYYSSPVEYADLSALADGAYIVQVISADKIESFEVIKQQ